MVALPPAVTVVVRVPVAARATLSSASTVTAPVKVLAGLLRSTLPAEEVMAAVPPTSSAAL